MAGKLSMYVGVLGATRPQSRVIYMQKKLYLSVTWSMGTIAMYSVHRMDSSPKFALEPTAFASQSAECSGT